jgi:hypothetical protein
MIAALGAYLLSGSAPPARGGAPIVVTGTSTSVLTGSDVTVEVYAENVPEPGVGAFNIDVLYNATTDLIYRSCRSNVAYCGSFPDEGRVRLAGAIAQGASGRVSIADLTFTASGRPASTHIEFIVNQFATPQSQELETTTRDAVITLVFSTPGPTPAPPHQGDTDCDGDVDTADALGVLRDTAGLPDPACINRGDVDCDADRDSVDALAILRHTAALPPGPQDEPCPDIGTLL